VKAIDPTNAQHGACAKFRDTEGNFMGLWVKTAPGDVETGDIEQTVFFKAKPAAVWKQLTDTKEFRDWSAHKKSTIEAQLGGYCSLFDGHIVTRNIEYEEGSRLVQSWRESRWPAGHFSRVEFVLAAKRGGTEVTMKQTAAPKDMVESLTDGWHEFYWNKMGAEQPQASKPTKKKK